MGTTHADFRNEVAVVTGAASGIGLEIARALHAAGARVHVFDRVAPGPEAFEHAEGRVPPVYHEVDVRETDQVDAAVARVLESAPGIDLLVNNAGITRDRALWNLEDPEWSEVLDVNLTGAFRVLRAVARPMRERGRGRIVQVASINGMRGKFGQANYSASKAGLIGLTRTAARDLGRRGITVNAVAPGMVESDMTRELPKEIREAARAQSALGGVTGPEDVAASVLFLLSDQAARVTGALLTVDGGQTA